ncbi:hypothetical protein [Corynebacterium efficiens YS-314]|uniref:Uncharacterized protein n=1 Tax=Corynebacterium efficiens (strain DSM 44549 / YS-314 / AJ 12310 / JCM 11189 / NBRC 100395) TaxID=196164 RepID=Q8FLR0_COREF|nr:hypothetical protein [Corynebacterium efficiens YS-314]
MNKPDHHEPCRLWWLFVWLGYRAFHALAHTFMCVSSFVESLILAQDERWRRA